MSERLVTIAAFNSPIEAELARNCVEDAGLHAFLADGETASTFWHLSGAVGGIKLQVGEHDAEKAKAALAASHVSDQTLHDAALESSRERGLLHDDGFDEELEPVLTEREQNADRALRGALLGLMLTPLQLYVFWLLIQVFVSRERLSPQKQQNAIIAAAINLPVMVGVYLLLRLLRDGPPPLPAEY